MRRLLNAIRYLDRPRFVVLELALLVIALFLLYSRSQLGANLESSQATYAAIDSALSAVIADRLTSARTPEDQRNAWQLQVDEWNRRMEHTWSAQTSIDLREYGIGFIVLLMLAVAWLNLAPRSPASQRAT